MTHFNQTLFLAMLCCAPATALAATPVSVKVSNCWVRALPGNLPSSGYFKMTNPNDQPINLVGVATQAFGMAMLHETRNKGSMSTMVAVKKVTVPAHGTLSFAPGNYHVMLEKPKKPVKPGMTILINFTFSNGQKTATECKVKHADAMSY
jgi:copper(I)-binding protein